MTVEVVAPKRSPLVVGVFRCGHPFEVARIPAPSTSEGKLWRRYLEQHDCEVCERVASGRPLKPCLWSFDYPIGSRETGGISTNHAYAPRGRGGRRLSPAATAFRLRVMLTVKRSGALAPIGPLMLRLVLFPPDERIRDVDGPIKLIQDAIAEVLGFNDRRIARVESVRRSPDPARPRIVAALLALGANPC